MNALEHVEITMHGSVCRALAVPSLLVSGVEDDPGGGVRVFLGPRYKGRYIVIDGADQVAAVRGAWSMTRSTGHLWVDADSVPANAIAHYPTTGDRG